MHAGDNTAASTKTLAYPACSEFLVATAGLTVIIEPQKDISRLPDFPLSDWKKNSGTLKLTETLHYRGLNDGGRVLRSDGRLVRDTESLTRTRLCPTLCPDEPNSVPEPEIFR